MGRSRKPPSRDQFAELVIDGIRQAGEPRRIVYDQANFRLLSEGEVAALFNLANAFDEYCAAPGQTRDRVVQTAVRNWFMYQKNLPDAFEDLHPDLLPSVRSRATFEFARLEAEIEGHAGGDWVHQVVADHLAVGLVYGMPQAIRLIAQKDLDRWGVSFNEAMDAARENLLEMSREAFHSPVPGTYVSPWADNHDASRMILLDLVRQLPVKGDPVVMIPGRDALIVTGADDEVGLVAMASLAEEAIKQPRPMTAVAFRLGGDRWAPWLPAADHPLHKLMKVLHLQSIGHDYAQQKKLLEALHRKTGENVFVATFSAMEEEQTGRAISHCAWPHGTVTLLPRTDRVFFLRTDEKTKDMEVAASGDWDRIVETVGDLMEPLDMYPQRYRVEFPSEEQLGAIGGGG